MSSHKVTSEVYNGVSTDDVPSAAFGWSKTPRSGIQIAGWFSVFMLLMYNFGNHKGHVETIWLFLLAIVLAVLLLIHLFQPKLANVRTLTARNQPLGHEEPEWAYEQKTLGNVYGELTDDELRALNIEPSRVSHLRTIETGNHAAH